MSTTQNRYQRPQELDGEALHVAKHSNIQAVFCSASQNEQRLTTKVCESELSNLEDTHLILILLLPTHRPFSPSSDPTSIRCKASITSRLVFLQSAPTFPIPSNLHGVLQYSIISCLCTLHNSLPVKETLHWALKTGKYCYRQRESIQGTAEVSPRHAR